MRRAGRIFAAPLGCALALAIAAGAQALGGPDRTHRPRAQHARCGARSHVKRAGARRRHTCHAKRRASTRAPLATGAPGAAGTSPASPGGSAGAPSSLTHLSPGGAPAQSSEGSTPPPGPPSLPHVQVISVEYRFTLSRSTVPAGKVMFEFVNHGQDEHNLNIRSAAGSLAGWFENTPAGGVKDQELELPPGSYTLFCSLPEHEQKGMKATLTVQ